MNKTTSGWMLAMIAALSGAAVWAASGIDCRSNIGSHHRLRHPGAASPTPTPTPINGGELPVVSPDGVHIAFVSNRGGDDDLYVIGSNGTGEIQLTRAPGFKTPLAWTADGKQLLSSLGTNEGTRIVAIGLDGKNQRDLGSVPGRTQSISPNRKQVLYMAGTWTSMHLMESALDGSQAQAITDGTSIAWNSDWSPDGKLIAFTSRNDPLGDLAIFVMNADGSARHQVSNFAAGHSNAQWPRWSPDGRSLAIQVNSRTLKGDSNIWIIDANTGEGKKLTSHDQPYLDETPSWFPDGKRLAFHSNRTGRLEVWVMNVDGSEQTQVTGLKR